jgi:hypothetical protein
MIRTLTRASLFIYLILAALLFATVFAIKADFFQYLVTAKQWKLEQTTLLVIAFLVVSLPFARRIKISLIDAGVLLFSLWWVLNEVILQTNYVSLGQTAFQVILWLSIYLFTRTGASDNKFITGVAIIFLLTALLQFPKVFNSKQETRNKKLLHPLPTPPNPLKGEPQTRIDKTPNPEHETRNQKLTNNGKKKRKPISSAATASSSDSPN